MFTTTDIFNIVWDWVCSSPLYAVIPKLYPYKYPDVSNANPLNGEFMVINTLSNSAGDTQVATVNVNIYVPDETPSINQIEQRFPNSKRLGELTKIAYGSLQGFPVSERWFFDVSSEQIISEEDIPYSFSNIKVTLKHF